VHSQLAEQRIAVPSKFMSTCCCHRVEYRYSMASSFGMASVRTSGPRPDIGASYFTHVRMCTETRAPSTPSVRMLGPPLRLPFRCPHSLRFPHLRCPSPSTALPRRSGAGATSDHDKAVALVREFTAKEKVVASHRHHRNTCNTRSTLKHPNETFATYV
jgi:hypothetical protein